MTHYGYTPETRIFNWNIIFVYVYSFVSPSLVYLTIFLWCCQVTTKNVSAWKILRNFTIFIQKQCDNYNLIIFLFVFYQKNALNLLRNLKKKKTKVNQRQFFFCWVVYIIRYLIVYSFFINKYTIILSWVIINLIWLAITCNYRPSAKRL